jgi:pimeloyl-ACP methyl ester carboxylesterase
MNKSISVILKVTASIVALIILLFVIAAIWLKSVSPGKTTPITDQSGKEIKGSIAEVNRIDVGGIKQFIVIRGESTENPVLLMLHGGPGSPQTPMNLKYNKELEKHFIVVNWDQRGAGGSYSKDMPDDSLNIDRMIEDTHEVSQYLISRFGKEKIFILGHSWGSYLGMRTINKYPELYQAYIGIGQVSNQRKSEELSYQFVLTKAKEERNKKAIKQLEEIGYPENGLYKNMEKAMMVERNWVMQYGGAAWKKDKYDIFTLFILPIFTCREYTVSDKFNYLKGMNRSLKMLWDPLMNQQLVDVVRKVDVPVYILQGTHDFQTCFSEAKKYYEQLEAPKKEFIEFTNSAHMLPYNLEIDKFHEVMTTKILKENTRQ